MKSLIVYEPKKFKLEDVEEPSNPEATQVLVKVSYCGICHTDFVVLNGEHPRAVYPCVLGHEFSGLVESIGPGVFNLKPGDRVTALSYEYCGICPACRRGIHNACINSRNIPFNINGAFQEKIKTSAVMYYKIPESLSLEEATLTEPAANGCAIIERANIYSGEKVVIIGPGTIGLLSLQIAAFEQPDKLIVVGTRDERLELASRLGATHTINIYKEDPYKTIMNITDGYGADVVLFCGGGKEAWQIAEKILNNFGRIIVEALPNKMTERWPVNVSKFTEKSIGFLGVSGYNGAQFEKALHLIAEKRIIVSPLITHKFILDEYKEAFETSDKRKEGAIKVLFKIT